MTIEYFLEDLPSVAKQILANANSKILLFDAAMGVGKTTLIKEICKQLGITDVISSPTYSLVNEYTSNSESIYHFDFYRIESENEAHDIGFEEYLNTESWVFIEWPEKVSNLLPEDTTTLRIELNDNEKRVLTFDEKS